MSPRLLASIAVVCAAWSGAGCDREPAGLDREVYIDAMARLTFADIVLFEEHQLDSARVAILTELGTTGEELVAFAERHGDDIAYMHEVWTRIRERVDSLERGPLDSIPADSGLATPPPP